MYEHEKTRMRLWTRYETHTKARSAHVNAHRGNARFVRSYASLRRVRSPERKSPLNAVGVSERHNARRLFCGNVYALAKCTTHLFCRTAYEPANWWQTQKRICKRFTLDWARGRTSIADSRKIKRETQHIWNIFIREISCLPMLFQEHPGVIYFRETNRDFSFRLEEVERWSRTQSSRHAAHRAVASRRFERWYRECDRWIRRVTERRYWMDDILSHATMRGSGKKNCFEQRSVQRGFL